VNGLNWLEIRFIGGNFENKTQFFCFLKTTNLLTTYATGHAHFPNPYLQSVPDLVSVPVIQHRVTSAVEAALSNTRINQATK
jgi:hypothetical protein